MRGERVLELQTEPLNCGNLLILFVKSVVEVLLSLPFSIQITCPRQKEKKKKGEGVEGGRNEMIQ